ncbi:MAG: hypothetical protein WCE30_09205 [Mycobacterium sp.]
MTARLDVGAYVVLGAGVAVTEGLDEVLCRVVRVEGDLRDVRRVSAATGEMEGIEVRFLASELRPARPAVLRWHEALRLRSAIAGWRRAVADDDEDVDGLAILVEAAEQLADLVIDADPTELDQLAVCGYVSDRDDAQVVEIDTTEDTGHVRVLINDGVIYDGDPENDEPPGEHYVGPGCPGLRRWKVQSLMTGDTLTITASSKSDASAHYLDTVMSNTLFCEDTTRPGRDAEHCDECGASTSELVSPEHGPACSLNPANEVTAQRSARPSGLDDVAARIDPTKARYAVVGVCAALGRKFDWSADTLDDVRDAVVPAAPSGCAPFFDQDGDHDDDAMAFWQNVFGS